MYRRSPEADARRIGQVLAAAEFPAAKWQLIAHAEHYGADACTRAELWSLPVATYPDLTAVLMVLGLLTPPTRARPGYRTQPGVQAAARTRPTS
ncbi:DUF2795 domain-containing protein [Pseudonocardia bannensis]|uniref:DUF2795 domain-containing protein n=1 Tax=Pseudonocardia bannensis TaxID=630973 RepID=A0A848DSR3_9PSEU|nr:DUF2795 domain-containing protein [Pseudonocardia bannensis]NMH95446.1 DUF2795 domain-containing protein [Pseudonocardia bannensis]